MDLIVVVVLLRFILVYIYICCSCGSVEIYACIYIVKHDVGDNGKTYWILL